MQSELKPADVWLLNYASRCVTAVEQATTASTTSKAKLVANILRQLVDEKDAIIDALCMENSEYCEALNTSNELPADVLDEVRDALQKAVDWFEEYAVHHRRLAVAAGYHVGNGTALMPDRSAVDLSQFAILRVEE